MSKKKLKVSSLDEYQTYRKMIQRNHLIHIAYHDLEMTPTEIVSIIHCSRPTVYAVLRKKVETFYK